jgi:ABC-2 type transport system ATP-binding protein
MPIIEVEHLQKRYGDTVAVSDVSFSIEEGEIFGILGPNGAGKTTSVEMLAGLRKPDAGRISVLGLDPRTDGEQLRAVVGVQLQESELPDKIEAGEALELYASFYPHPADPQRLLDTLGLAEKRSTRWGEIPVGLREPLGGFGRAEASRRGVEFESGGGSEG